MNLQKMTQKSVEALRAAQENAVDNGNQELRQEHLLWALVRPKDGLIAQLFEKMNAENPEKELAGLISSFPKISGMGADKLYLSAELEKAIRQGEDEAEKMKDSFVSVEHLMLGLLDEPSAGVK